MGRAALEEAQNLEQRLSPPVPIHQVADSVNSATNVISNQSNLVASVNSLLDKVGALVKVGDEIAKVCRFLISCLFFYSEWSKDPSICQLCVAGPLCRAQGEDNQAIIPPVFSLLYSGR